MNKEEQTLQERQLEETRLQLKKYDEMQVEINKLKNSLNKCIEIVNTSIINPTINSNLEYYQEENEHLHKKALEKIRNDISDSEDLIKKLNEQIKEEKEQVEEAPVEEATEEETEKSS